MKTMLFLGLIAFVAKVEAQNILPVVYSEKFAIFYNTTSAIDLTGKKIFYRDGVSYKEAKGYAMSASSAKKVAQFLVQTPAQSGLAKEHVNIIATTDAIMVCIAYNKIKHHWLVLTWPKNSDDEEVTQLSRYRVWYTN
jgi:hypothetical protein